ncbi:hypothetical protein [Saccharomonospora xinjiangensis]|uniref:Uncharacterized protein n=1 Tax=Saccharomonospora xinjiangensis XJ-54 TaxID=882086 RepID=I0V0R2_9PSEU|nr:hypothetical protein [Saccharomonospora xinjiangensis]EID53715.1 hypothetical protein SacxiDRAFT_1467 [Saccharomonospora xinjiangensis XJ-54]
MSPNATALEPTSPGTVRFDEAWAAAERIADDAAQRGADVVLVRDILGRASLIVDTAGPQVSLDDLARQLAAAAGPFTGPAPVRRASELFAPASILDSTESVVRRERTDTHGRLAVLDNRIAFDIGRKGGVPRVKS